MKTIVLLTARLDNGGRRLPAGTEVSVGKKDDQVAPDRAKAMVHGGEALDTTPKPAKKAGKPAPADETAARGKDTGED